MSQLGQDIRFSLRGLVKQPGFALAAILTLALGIGANTAIFSVADAVLLQPSPFRHPERVVICWGWNADWAKVLSSNDLPQSTANLFEFQQAATSFEALALVQAGRESLTGQGDPEQLSAVLVTPDFFKILARPALIGRTLGPEDDAAGAPLATVLSFDLWQRRFAGDRSVIGRSLVMNGKQLTVVGVMPPRFTFPLASEMPSYLGFAAYPDVWVPRALTEDDRDDRGNRISFMIGRLKPGSSRQAAEQELNGITRHLAQLYPRANKGWSVRLVPIVEQMTRVLRPILLLLWTAVALVLIIACANVASLLLARAAARQREIAMRTALGAGRWRLVRQLLLESGMLSLLGGALGALLAWACLRLLAHAVPAGLAGAATFTLDARALGFTLLLCALTSLLAGLFPAFQSTRPDAAGALQQATRASTGTARSRSARSALVVAEMAVTVLVLIGAGLLLRSFDRLMDVDPGFRVDHVLSFRIDMPADRPKDQLASFYSRLDHQLRSLPGAADAAIVSELPMGGIDSATAVVLEGKPKPEPGKFNMVGGRMATPGYFKTLNIPLVKGRLLEDGDTRDKAMAAVVDEAMAATYWPGEEVLGKRFKRLDTRDSPWVTVVGVVGNLRHADLYSDPRPTLFMTPDQTSRFYMPTQAAAVLLTKGDPRTLSSSVRRAVLAVDRDQPISQIRPLTDVLNQSIAKNRLSLLLLSLLAVLALILAMVGIYGITSYSIALRTREIGLRMALGARPGEVLLRVVRETAWLAVSGIVLGIGLAFPLVHAAASYISVLLYRVESTDPMTFAGVALVLALVALGAAYLAGRRATRVSPMVALRAD